MSERGAGVGPGETLRLRLVVNRRLVELLVPPHRTLLEVLREDLGLTGTKHGCEYPTGSVLLAPGEALYLYTDGVTEALNESDEQFSAPRLEAYLTGATGATAADLVRGSLAAMQDFVGATPQSDDITILALRYRAS